MKKVYSTVAIVVGLYFILWMVPGAIAPKANILKGDAFEVMAHRAGEGNGPSNTIEAALIAHSMGVDYIEMDVHRTSDGVFVTIHNPTIDETTDGKGTVKDLSFEEIQKFDAGYGYESQEGGRPFVGKGIMIPALEAVFGALPNAKYNLEIKPDDSSFSAPFCTLLRKYGMENQVLVGSFNEEPLIAFRKACPEIPTSLYIAEIKQFVYLEKLGLSNLASFNGAALQVPIENDGITIVTPSFIKAAHDRGLEVHVWTVNDTETIKWLHDIGADGVITDYPDRAM